MFLTCQTDAIVVSGMAYATGKGKVERNAKQALKFLCIRSFTADRQIHGWLAACQL